MGEMGSTEIHILKTTVFQLGIGKVRIRDIGIMYMQYFTDIVFHGLPASATSRAED